MAENRSHSDEQFERLVKWAQARRRPLTIAGAVVLVAAGGLWFASSARERRETFAARELNEARATAEAGNVPLAISDLQRVVERYGGTRGGQEAAITLAQLRLMQNQAELAAAQLQDLVRTVDDVFRDQAWALLGTALEEVGRAQEAGDAFIQAAEATDHELVAAQMLMSAGRAFATASDTTASAAAYQRVLDEHAETGAVIEARLRLAELRRTDIPG